MQVATLFRESSTLLGATSMMESAAATSAPTLGSSSSTSTSPPLQAQSPPQLLQQEQQTTSVDATIISATENEAQMTATTQLGADPEVNTNNNTETIVSASLSISSLPPPVTDSDVSADNPIEEEPRVQLPRSPTLLPSPLPVPEDMDTEQEVQQEDHSQSPVEPDVVGDDDDGHQITVQNSPCLPAQLNEDVDMADVSAPPLNNSDPSRDDHYPIVNSVNQMDGCDSNNDNDTGSAAPEPSDCKEDNQAVEQQNILHEEPQEHLKELESMHEPLPNENDTEMLTGEELSPPPNVSPPRTNVPINLITEQLEHQEHHMLPHHHQHRHHQQEYPEVQQLQHDQVVQQQQLQQDHQQHLKQDRQQHLEQERQHHLEQERQQHLEQERQHHLEQERQQHREQDHQRHLEQDRQRHLEQDRQRHLEQDRQEQLQQDHQQHLGQDIQQQLRQDHQQHLEQDSQQQLQQDHQQHLQQDLQQQLRQDRQQHLEQDLQQQLQQDRQQQLQQDRQQQLQQDHQQQQLQHEQKQAQNHLQQLHQQHQSQQQQHEPDHHLHHDQGQQQHHILQHEHEQQQQHHHQLQHGQEQQQHHHQLQHDQHRLQRERDAQHQHNLTVPHHEQLSQHHMQPHEPQDHMQQHHYHHHQFHPQTTSQMHMQQQHHHPQQRHHQTHPITCIDDLMIEDNHEDPSNRYKLLSPSVKHESQDDGYETSAGDVLTPSSHASSHSMTPQHQAHTSVILPKCEIPPPPQNAVDDPYNFIDDELNNSIQLMSPSGGPLSLRQQYAHHATGPPGPLGAGTSSMMNSAGSLIPLGGQIMGPGSSGITAQGLPDLGGPKKRGRKKKIREENGTMVNGILKPVVHKERKKHDRFNGMPEEEVSKRTLPDHLANNLDIIIIGINPGLFAAYKGHHYAGPGNHFWKCLYLSGLTREQMTAEEDYKLLEFGIGFTNMVERATKGSADLTRKEIKEGCRTLLDKLRKFRPKIAVFNGKLIFEVFSGKKDFNFGRQPECIEGTNTYMWVMPSSSARCAQLPRAADKVPFYAALKKFRDYLNGLIPHIEESECVFSDPKYKQCCEPEPKTENLGYSEITDLSNCSLPNPSAAAAGGPQQAIQNCGGMGENNDLLQPGKKKRGRPKKVKGLDGCDDGKMNPRRLTLADSCNSNNNGLNLSIISNCSNGDMPKKKRGRPKKIKAGDLLSSSSANSLGILSGSMLNGNSNASSNNGMTNGLEAINNSDLNHNSPNGGMGSLCGGLSQQQQQRLFSPPMHSPSTVGSYCPLGLNASTPPISTNCNNNNGYHHHPHHQMGTPQHHHNTHQQHHPSYHQQTSQQPPPQQYTPHSDLSSEISAAISSEHLGESPTPTSPSLGHPDFDPPGSMHTDDTNPNELRFSSPASTISEQQQAGSHLGGHLAGYPPYRNPGSNNSYMSGSGGSSNDGHGSDGYMQPASNQSQQQAQQQTTNASGQPLQMSDVASKSLSGLESLVDQIPTMSESDGTTTPNHMSNANPDARLCDPNDQYSNNCLYSGYPNNMQLNSSSPSATPNSSMLSPHYTNPNFSSNPIATNCTTTNTSTYGSLSSNFSVSSLTSSNYPTSSYHSNLMASSPHHIGSGSGSSPMYMEPHMPVPVNPLYHPYSQHSGYSGYSPVAPPPTIHMPSPNYPYGYGNTGSYPQPGHHPSHPAAGYLSNHPSMFDRIKPDIGYGGF